MVLKNIFKNSANFIGIEMDYNKYCSQETDIIDAAIGKFQNKIGVIAKVNTGFKWSYASWDDVLPAALPVLEECGLVVKQPICVSNNDACIVLVTIIAHPASKQWTSARMPIALHDDQKIVAGSVTYWKRQCFNALLGIVTSDDSQVEKSPPSQKSNLVKSTQETAISTDNLQHLMRECASKPGLQDRIMQKYNITSLNDLYDREYLEIIAMMKGAKQ